ncbi:MAG: hypothetical protein IIB56_07510 [Planctomycetes bacterium]|nr:hypothetical protein [Planctomycetota bacterium]
MRTLRARMTLLEVRGQKSEIRSQKSKVRSQSLSSVLCLLSSVLCFLMLATTATATDRQRRSGSNPPLVGGCNSNTTVGIRAMFPIEA